MKKSVLFILVVSIITSSQANAQGGLLKKVSKSMTNELLGRSDKSSNKAKDQPEPQCACDKPEIMMDLGGKLQLDYTELSISISDDGRILAKQRWTDDYYIVQNGITTGPLKQGDKRLSGFEIVDDSDESGKKHVWENNQYITRSGEKYEIKFGGTTYGPFAEINSFTVSKSKDKFAALVTENIVVTEDQGKKMDEAIANAKTEQEKMDIAMQFSQEMAQKIIQNGGPQSTIPKVITNIPGSNYDPMKGGTFNSNMKYDDILVAYYDRITDMQGNTVIKLSSEFAGTDQVFVNTDNSKYAVYNYGTLTFSDNSTLSELFNPHLLQINGQVYLAYFYYSPKKNAIIQCKIVF